MKPRTRPEWLAAGLLSALLSGCPQLASDEFNKAVDPPDSDDGSAIDSGGSGGGGSGGGGAGGKGGTGGGGIDLSTVTLSSVGGGVTTETTSQGGTLTDTNTDAGGNTTDAGGNTTDTGSDTTDAGGNTTDASSSTGMPPECMREEVCDGLDNDCDGDVDEGEPCEALCEGFALEDHGYMFCGTLTSATEAATVCSELGLALVQIDSAEENDALVEAVSSLYGALAETSEQPGFWSGGADKMEGAWVWTGSGTPFWNGKADGEPVEDAFNNWGDGRPNEKNEYPEDCAVVYLPEASDGTVGTWNDLNCGEEYTFVCEAE